MLTTTAYRDRSRQLRQEMEAASRDLTGWMWFPATDPLEDRIEGCIVLLHYHMCRKAWRDHVRTHRKRSPRLEGPEDTVLAAPPG